MRIILASGSPRRKELLENMGVKFDIITSNIDETRNTKLPLKKQIEDIAYRKAYAVAKDIKESKFVIGSDTIVCLHNKVLGKPKNEENAKEMLRMLSGKTHKVITGLAVIVEDENGERIYKTNSLTKVYFKKLTEEEIDNYVATKEPLDKASAYAIQGKSSVFINKIKGNYFSVVGFPIHKLYEIMKKEKI